MVARAQKRKWIDLVVSLVVVAATQPLALLAGSDIGFALPPASTKGEEQVIAQLGGGSSRARVALNAAIDAERLGDLDKAAGLFQEAQARAKDLTADERRELDRRLAANALALQARREAREQIGLAESAFQHGQPADAGALIKQIKANELYLSPSDKQRFQMLCQRMYLQPGAAPGASLDAATFAHDKMRQARTALDRADLDAAEALAREADQLHAPLGPQDDSPRKILDDLDKAHRDPKTLLLAARAALRRVQLDRAEQFARSAEQLASPFTFMLGDSPSKVLKDIEVARRLTPPPAVSASGSPLPNGGGSEGVAAPMPTANTGKARALVRQGRQALASGDFVQARKCAEQASTLKADLQWSEDNPAKLLADINRAAPGAAGVAPVAATAASAAASIKTKDEALALLKQGREQLAKGELEEANKTAARLRVARHIHWGLFFEDTPDKFQADVNHARLHRDKEQSVQLLAEARIRLEKKDYAGAEKLAWEARSKHGQYSIWDLGDRPNKLLADVEAARQKERRVKLPDAPKTPNEVADLSHGPLAATAANAVAQTNPTNPNGLPLPTERLAQRPPLNPAPGGIGVAPVNPSITQVAANKPNSPSPYLPSVLEGNTEAKRNSDNLTPQTRARRLLAEAHALQRQNLLIEARDKIDEARRLGVSFRPDEESPNQVYQQVAFLARQRIDSLVHHAGETLRYGTQAPTTRCQEAERDLSQARELAVAFGQDIQPIELTQRMVHQLRTTGNATLVNSQPEPNPMLPPSVLDKGSLTKGSPSAETQGTSKRRAIQATLLLDQARLELRSGETANARHLAEEAVKLDASEAALAVIRSIDAEDAAQNRRKANRTFDEVLQAYHNREYRRARVLLACIDIKLLDERRMGRLREIVNTPEMRTSAGGGAIVLTGAQDNAKPQAAGAGGDGRARATDDPGQSLLAQTRAMREIKFQQLRTEGLAIQSQALERFRTGQTDVAVNMLEEYLLRLSEQ
ncbi:MAG: hypothetical protein ACRELG_05150, partial [Gemmataceae bacterium]